MVIVKEREFQLSLRRILIVVDHHLRPCRRSVADWGLKRALFTISTQLLVTRSRRDIWLILVRWLPKEESNCTGKYEKSSWNYIIKELIQRRGVSAITFIHRL